MRLIERKILSLYNPGETSVNIVAKILGIDFHHTKRVLVKYGIDMPRAQKLYLSEARLKELVDLADSIKFCSFEGVSGETERDKIEKLIIDSYIPGYTSCRDIAKMFNLPDHKLIISVLKKHGIEFIDADAITPYKIMAGNIRFDVSLEWLYQFDDLEKLKTLNDCISNRDNRYNETSEWYMEYILKFWNCSQFNKVYNIWLESDKDRWKKPSIDHIIPRSKGGTNHLNNLQFMSWLENMCKNNTNQEDWNIIKKNMHEYFL